MTDPLNIPPDAPQFIIPEENWKLHDFQLYDVKLTIHISRKVAEIASQPNMELQFRFVKKGE